MIKWDLDAIEKATKEFNEPVINRDFTVFLVADFTDGDVWCISEFSNEWINYHNEHIHKVIIKRHDENSGVKYTKALVLSYLEFLEKEYNFGSELPDSPVYRYPYWEFFEKNKIHPYWSSKLINEVINEKFGN